jgi:hypothetical protein
MSPAAVLVTRDRLEVLQLAAAPMLARHAAGALDPRPRLVVTKKL